MLEALRKRVVEGLNDEVDPLPQDAVKVGDDVLHRFLRARQWKLDAAYAQLKKYILWFQKYKNILREKQKKEFFTLTPHIFYGFSKVGEPIFWGLSGRTNVTKVLQHVSYEAVLHRHIYSVEKQLVRMKQKTKELGKLVETQIMILDLTGLTFQMDARGSTLFKDTIQIDQDFYPEILGHLFIINAPWIFKGMWALISPWIDPVTSKKIHILGGDYLNTLLKYIDLDQIPKEYGGTADVAVGTWDDNDLDFLVKDIYEN
uniref:CRAL-TRIO domain-containing protein n=1 Tax=Arcella intermedia TaxID=1963864 RepID=A0A6B2LE39_9EUKA